MADGSIIIDTKIDSTGAEKEVANLGNRLGSVAKTGLKVFTGAITAAGTAIGGLAGVATKYNSQMEDYFANFTVLLGSATKAAKHVEDLKKFAAKTPFEMTGLADASKQLLSFGINVDDIMPDLQMLGDISLGNQERFKGLALVFAQVASAGKLTGQDLMQFINQGFNPLQAIAEKTGKSMAELKEEMSDGKITYEMVAEAMKTATSEGGKFYQGMEVQSQTLSGMWSTLKDDTMSLIGDAFKPFSETLKTNVMPALQEMIKQMSDGFSDPNIQTSISNIAERLGELAVKLGEIISEYLPQIIEGFAWILDNSGNIAAGIAGIGAALVTMNVANMIMKLVSAFKGVKTATEAWLVVQKLLNIELFANPIGLIVAAIAGLVAGIVVLWNTNEDFRNAVINIWENIKEVGSNVWGGICDFFTETIPEAFNSVKAFFTEEVPNWFNEQCEKVKQFFIDGWNSIVAFFTETIPLWIENIVNWFSELPYKIGYVLGELLGTIIQGWVNIFNYFAENIPIWIDNIVNWFSELPGRIYDWLVNTLDRVNNWAIEMHNKSQEVGKKFLDAIIEWFSTLPSRISEWFSNTIDKVVQWGSDMYDKASTAARETAESIVDWFKELPGNMLDIGKNIVQGIWNGIKNAKDWLWDKITGFCSGIMDGFKNALGIHSPSRLMRDIIGKNLVKGISVGIDTEMPDLDKQINSNINELAAKLKGTVDYETAKTSAMVAGGRINNTTNTITHNDNGITQNVTIVNPERTPSENARALKKAGRDLAFG
ncbi:MAG: tape measure protein [Clostridium sp.]|uniref:phage tail protein n=1 Tax=Clostridium sp. TaxID=1506 RepID=UPI002A881DC0|nr:tape measure protein [Clostridium sp.]MDY5098502.1 tape measure protein [Clostridium sp.]